MIVKDIRFYLEPETGLPHIYKHDIETYEVIEAIRAAGEDRQGRDGSRILIGQTKAGRYLRVIYTFDGQSKVNIFVITAYELRGKSLAAYKRRRKKKGT